MAKQRRSRDKSFSQEEDLRGVIIVIFKKGTPAETIRRLVREQQCKLQKGFDGTYCVNCIEVPKGKDEECVAKFLKLPEVKKALLNEWEVTL